MSRFLSVKKTAICFYFKIVEKQVIKYGRCALLTLLLSPGTHDLIDLGFVQFFLDEFLIAPHQNEQTNETLKVAKLIRITPEGPSTNTVTKSFELKFFHQRFCEWENVIVKARHSTLPFASDTLIDTSHAPKCTHGTCAIFLNENKTMKGGKSFERHAPVWR